MSPQTIPRLSKKWYTLYETLSLTKKNKTNNGRKLTKKHSRWTKMMLKARFFIFTPLVSSLPSLSPGGFRLRENRAEKQQQIKMHSVTKTHTKSSTGLCGMNALVKRIRRKALQDRTHPDTLYLSRFNLDGQRAVIIHNWLMILWLLLI